MLDNVRWCYGLMEDLGQLDDLRLSFDVILLALLTVFWNIEARSLLRRCHHLLLWRQLSLAPLKCQFWLWLYKLELPIVCRNAGNIKWTKYLESHQDLLLLWSFLGLLFSHVILQRCEVGRKADAQILFQSRNLSEFMGTCHCSTLAYQVGVWSHGNLMQFAPAASSGCASPCKTARSRMKIAVCSRINRSCDWCNSISCQVSAVSDQNGWNNLLDSPWSFWSRLSISFSHSSWRRLTSSTPSLPQQYGWTNQMCTEHWRALLRFESGLAYQIGLVSCHTLPYFEILMSCTLLCLRAKTSISKGTPSRLQNRMNLYEF